jgi:hypothetical protein
LAFASDLNTGIYSPSADQLAIATNGVERVEWGTTEVVFNDGGTNYDFRIEGDTVDSLFFVDASTDRVGLGTSAPWSKLSVGSGGTATPAADVTIHDSSVDAWRLKLTSDNFTTNTKWLGLGFGYHSGALKAGILAEATDAFARPKLHFCLNNSANSDSTSLSDSRMVITPGGLVGIGTATPNAALHAGGTSANPVIFAGADSGDVSYKFRQSRGTFTSPSGTGGEGIKLSFEKYTGPGTGWASPIAEIYAAGGGDGADGYLAFLTKPSGGSATERARIDSSGRLLVGTSTATAVTDGNVTPRIELEGTDAAGTATLGIIRNSNDAGGSSLVLAKSRGTTAGSNTVVVNGDTIGVIRFEATDGTQKRIAATVYSEVDGTPGANDMPGRLVFSTTADGASSPTERARVTSSGWLRVSQDGSGSYAGGNYHEINNNQNDWALVVRNVRTAAGCSGLVVNFPGQAPNDTGNQFVFCSDSTAVRAEIRSNGGLANYSANNVNLSDRNVKKDISPATGTWDCLKEWEIVNFRYKDQPDDADLNMGVIAQQVVESCPEVITVFQEAKEATETEPAQEERLGVKDQQMMWMAIKALQEAQLRIETLEAEVAALKGV